MAFEAPIAIGSLNWGTPVNDTFLDLDARVRALNEAQTSSATDQNLLAWTFDPATNLGASQTSGGGVYMSKIILREPATVTNILATVTTAGSGLVLNQNFAALYDDLGNRLGVTGNQSVAWAVSGLKTMPLTAPVVNPAGVYYAALLSNGTTQPTFARGSLLSAGPETVNAGLTASTYRYSLGPTAQTSMPLSITMGARSADARSWWMALS